MMKKYLLLTLMLLMTASAFAVEVEIDGLWYELVSKKKEATIIQYKNNIKYSGNIVIPPTLEYEETLYSVTRIGENAFNWCTSLTSVTIPNNVTNIGAYAFYGCSGLTSISIPNNVTSIENNAFWYCTSLTSVTIPNNVTNIGAYAFFDCSSLNSVTISNSITSIEQCVFQGCSSLTSVTIPSSVTSIGFQAFMGCSGLNSVTIPNSVTSIGFQAFSGCSGLTSITIGSGVTTIYSSSFSNCPELTDVYCNAKEVPSTSSNAFDGSHAEYATLHVPVASINAYNAASPWSGFKNIVSLGTTVTIGLAGMATYCPMDDVDFSMVNGLKAYTATGYDHGTLTVSRVLNAPAGTGLLLQGDAGTYDVPYATSTGYYINLLYGLMEDTQVSPTEGSYTNFILGQKNNVVSFYRLSEAGVVAAGKAYLQLPTSVVEDVVSGSRVMRIVAEDETTGIRSVELLTNNVRGKGEELFDLQGRRVANPSKGIYIVGGQKVVVK